MTFLRGDATPTSGREASTLGLRPSTELRLRAARQAAEPRAPLSPATVRSISRLPRQTERLVWAWHDRSLLPVPCADLLASHADTALKCSRPCCSPPRS